MEMNFCRRCGSSLTDHKKNAYTCERGHTIFANASPTVGIFFVTDNNEVLLAERGIEPRKGMLDSFGGFVDGAGETLEQAAKRELKEELDLDETDYEPLRYLTSGTGTYPYQADPLPILSSFFWTRLTSGKQLQPADDVAAIRTIPVNEVDMNLLHDNDIKAGMAALQTLLRGLPADNN